MQAVNNVLEYNINQIIKALNKNGSGFGWKNHPNRNHTGQYLNGEPFDYCFILKDKVMVFDAKHIESKKWSLKDKDIKQAKNLKQCQKNKNIKAIFVIYFKEAEKLVSIDASEVIKILKTRKTISIDDCIPFKYENLLN